LSSSPGAVAWVGVTHHATAAGRTRREQAALAARADEQHALILAGDDRGVYGDYPPAVA
jgi:hypothetical protein